MVYYIKVPTTQLLMTSLDWQSEDELLIVHLKMTVHNIKLMIRDKRVVCHYTDGS